MLDYTIDPSANEKDAAETAEFIDAMNELLELDLIRMEIDDNGESRFYPN